MITSPFARTVWYPGNELADKNHFDYLDTISLGCIAAIITKRIEINKYYLTAAAITGWLLFILIVFFRKWVYQIGLTNIGLNVTLLAIGTGLILIWMQKRYVSGQHIPSGYTGILRFLGKNSYEIYLTHMFVVCLFVRLYNTLDLSGEWAWSLYISVIVVSGLLGNLVAKYFSIPFNNSLREKFKKVNPKNQEVS